MKLEAHIEELAERATSVVEAKNSMVEVSNRRSLRNLYGLILPELYRAEGRMVIELGKTAGALFKLTPHVPEIYRMRKEREIS